jgi:hypothetical protein
MKKENGDTLMFLLAALWICIGLGFALHSFWWGFACFPIAFKVMSFRYVVKR